MEDVGVRIAAPNSFRKARGVTEYDAVDKAIVERLFADGEVNLYELHAERRFSPASLVRSVIKLQQSGIVAKVDREGQTVYASDRSSHLLYRLRFKVFKRRIDWKQVPERYLDNQLPVDAPYRPVHHLLGKFMLSKRRNLGE